MAIISYDAWMRRTKQGITKPRSADLRLVDTALKNYGQKRDPAAFDALYAAVVTWVNGKDDARKSIRNKDGAVDELLDGLIEQYERNTAGKAALVTAKADIARMNRPAGFLAEIQGGKKLLDQGKLSGKFSKAGLATIVKDTTSSNVSYEGFSGAKLTAAQRGWANALNGAKKAAMGMRAVQMGMATGMGQTTPERARFTKWFGAADRTIVGDMARKADLMDLAMRTREITFVLREGQTMHYVDGNDPLGPMEDDVLGPGVYGYVWSAGNHTGNGMRIVCNDMFLNDPCPFEGAAATIYHELTHKVLGTSDKSSAGATTYGIAACTALAKSDPASARNVADCWSYYAVSFLKAI